MSRIVVLGGSGVVGSVAVRTLVKVGEFAELVVADINHTAAERLVSDIGDAKLTAVQLDATDPQAIKSVIEGANVVLNCSGPFYKLGPIILEAVIESGIDYVDVCDDYDATVKLLEMHEAARQAGVSALIGMGSSPGVANLLARLCAEMMLDEVESIDILHAHGGEPHEGAAVIAHRFHSMTSPIPMYLDGKYVTVDYFEESGVALEAEHDFHQIGTYLCYPYPHPETLTLPKYIDCRRVTNLGCVLPPEYYDLTRELVKLGLSSETPLNVKGQDVSPFDFTIAYIIQERERILQETNFGVQRGCLKISMKGTVEGKPHQFDFSLSSVGQSMGEGTGIPAALGAILMNRGKITEKGVLPPEACVNPLDFLGLMQEFLGLEGATSEGSPLIIESIDADGKIERVSL
ncbi:MAG: saccharopine dehydrogenase NADP-binding domain-containing protein [Candidatus Thorarchaeota archaeon]